MAYSWKSSIAKNLIVSPFNAERPHTQHPHETSPPQARPIAQSSFSPPHANSAANGIRSRSRESFASIRHSPDLRHFHIWSAKRSNSFALTQERPSARRQFPLLHETYHMGLKVVPVAMDRYVRDGGSKVTDSLQAPSFLLACHT